MHHVVRNYNKLCSQLEPFAQLIARLGIGFVFAQSGWGKLHHLDKVTQFFGSLGIPVPQVQAPMVATIELVGGVLLILGLGTRVVSLFLIAIMIVAIATAKLGNVDSLGSFIQLSEFLFIALLLWLMARGAGPVSVDAALARKNH